jgi:hypothetical protein
LNSKSHDKSEAIAQLVKQIVDDKSILAAGLVRVNGEVISSYHGKRSRGLFDIILRESVANKRSRSIRFPSLGRLRSSIAEYDKLTLAAFMITETYYLYAVSRSGGNPIQVLRKLESLGSRIRKLIR